MPQVYGNWEIRKKLGGGAFGDVYKGRHRLLGASFPVVIKREKTFQDPYTRMFRNEAALLARLRHPQFPTLLDYLEVGGDVGQLMVLSYIPGTPLDKHLEKQGAIADEHICWILDRVLGALDYLHIKHGIVHCDIKPANCILDIPDHQVTLVDLGMATLAPDEKTKAKGGTPGYMAPEFQQGFPPIPESDLYSVGKLGIALAGGDIHKGEPPNDMAEPLADLLLEMIARDPTKRYASADQVRHELHHLRQKVWGRVTTATEFENR